MKYNINEMESHTKVSNTGYWESDIELYHVRCEPLCDWVINYLSLEKETPFYDFGCGNGHYLSKLKENGFINLTGFEGKVPKYPQFNNIIEQDLTKYFSVKSPGNCLFLEVAEHIPCDFEDVLLKNVVNACSNKLIMSWAIRGQGGRGHINCLNNDEVIDKLKKYNMKYLDKDTILARNSIPDNNPYFWFKNTTLIFEK